MKHLLNILFLLPLFASAQKRIPVYAGSDSIVYCIDVMKQYNPAPGDVLVIMNRGKAIKAVKLENICGADGLPITVTLEDTTAFVGGYGSYSFAVSKVSNVRFSNIRIDGKNNSNSLFAVSKFHHVIIEDFVFKNSKAIGLSTKTDYVAGDSTTWFPAINTDITIKRGSITNVGTEGIYAGTSNVRYGSDSVIGVPIIGMTVEDVTTDSTGWDGIQFSNVQNLTRRNLTIKNFGLKNQPSQRSGLLTGSSVTTTTTDNILIENGTGNGMEIFGKGSLPFNNVRILNAAKTEGESGIYIDSYDSPFCLDSQRVVLSNVYVNGASKGALTNINRKGTAKPIDVNGFTFLNTAFIKGAGTFTNIVDATPKPPIDTIVTKPIDTPVVVVPVADTIRISSNYAVQTTPLNQVIVATGTAKIFLPDNPPDSFTVKIIQPARDGKVTFAKRLYFTNGKYRLINRGMMHARWKAAKKKYYIIERKDNWK